TWNKNSPYPEEANRQLTDVLADLYFAPTQQSRRNLLEENHRAQDIFITGNTAIDAMKYTIQADYKNFALSDGDHKHVIVTMHRRENLGEPMKQVFRALKRIALEFPQVVFIFPMHKNPQVRQLAQSFLDNLENVQLIETLSSEEHTSEIQSHYEIVF